MTWVIVKLAIRLVVFTGVFWFATRPRADKRIPRVSIQPRWAIPLIGLLFAAMNIALYWALRPLLDLATMRMFTFVMPFVVNGLLLWGTARIVQRKQWLRMEGMLAAAYLAAILTVAHGALWLGLDYFPSL